MKQALGDVKCFSNFSGAQKIELRHTPSHPHYPRKPQVLSCYKKWGNRMCKWVEGDS